MVDESVDHRTGSHGVAKYLRPLPEGQVGRDGDAGPFIASRDVEEQVRYCEDIADDIALQINLFIPKNADAVRDVFDRLGVEYEIVAAPAVGLPSVGPAEAHPAV
jgi:hypothetical protein